MRKKINIAGIITYAILAVLAIVLYRERAAFLDISFHLFYIIKDGDFAIQNHRFVAGFTQLFPLLASKAGLGLESIMKLYSLSFVVLNAAIFFILSGLLKSWKFGLAVILLNTLMVTHTFYWIQSELQQGLPVLILTFGLLHYYAAKGRSSLGIKGLFFILLITLVFAHPLVVFPFIFLSIFFVLYDRKSMRLYGLYAGVFIVLYFLKSIFFKTAYDSSSMGNLRNFISYFPNYFTLPSNKHFIHDVVNDYYFLVLGFLLVVWEYLRKKQYLKLVLVAASFLGYLLIVNVSFPDGAERFYMENLYLPLSIFVIFPLVFDVAPRFNRKQIIRALLLVLIIRIADIYHTHRFYTNRVDYLNELIDEVSKEEHKKVLIPQTDKMKSKLLMSWATPYEVWLLSTIRTGHTTSIMVTDSDNNLDWMLHHNKKFVTRWGLFKYDDLPSKYFVLQDTSFYVIRR